RTLNFAFIAITAVVCLGLYRIAEQARVAQAELRSTQFAIAREQDAMAVLGAEWARVTQPARVQALAERLLPLSDKPTMQLTSLTSLPAKDSSAPEIRDAKAVVPVPETQKSNSDVHLAALKTGT